MSCTPLSFWKHSCHGVAVVSLRGAWFGGVAGIMLGFGVSHAVVP
jgi:hypothetical protein